LVVDALLVAAFVGMMHIALGGPWGFFGTLWGMTTTGPTTSGVCSLHRTTDAPRKGAVGRVGGGALGSWGTAGVANVLTMLMEFGLCVT
jgi:hypothetical protein